MADEVMAPRNRFRPPRWIVPQVDAGDLTALGPVPLLTDRFGEMVPTGTARIALGHTSDGFLLAVDCPVPAGVARSDLAIDHQDFWRQDHVELRLAPAGCEPVQLMIASDGRIWCAGRNLPPAKILPSAGWRLHAALPCADLGLPVPVAGEPWRGFTAHVRWDGDRPDFACASAAVLGFAQRERHLDVVLTPKRDVLMQPCETPTGELPDVPFALGVPLCSRRGASGRLRVIVERDADEAGSSLDLPVELPPGRTITCRVPVTLERTLYRRLSCWWVDRTTGAASELGALCLRAGAAVPDLGQVRPGLLLDDEGLAQARAACAHTPFAPLIAEVLGLGHNLLDEAHLPPPQGYGYTFDRGAMNWFRVAKESMVHAQTPAGRRIWELQPPEAHAAWHEVIRTVEPQDAQLAVLIPALDRLLTRRDLWDADDFARVHLPPVGHDLLARGVATLSDAELAKLNRVLFQSAVECCHQFKIDLPGRIGAMFTAWLCREDPRLIDLASRTAAAAADWMIPSAEFHLHEGNVSSTLALAYACWRDRLDATRRAGWRHLLTQLLDLYLATARRQGWTVTAIPNANPVGNAGGGLLALALANDEPERAREALAFALKHLTTWLDWCAGSDGGNTEGAQYWAFGTESFLRFAVTLERVTGSDHGLLSHPAIVNAMAMVRVSLCNDGGTHGANDTVPVPCGGEVAWWLARRGDALALWYGDHCLRHAAARSAAGKPSVYRAAPLWALLSRPLLPEATAQPGPLPTAFALHSIEYGILRSHAAWNCRWTTGIKGARGPYTHHNQADTGALWADLRGERLLIDPGYYKPKPQHHCLPLVDGKGPREGRDWDGRITACDEIGDLRWLACDSTAAYGGAARRVRRALVLCGDDAVVMVDDVDTDGVVTLQWQCGGPAEVDATTARIAMPRCRARLDIDGATALAAQPERNLHDVHWGYHFADCRWIPLTATAGRDPVVAVLLDTTDGDAGPVRIARHADRIDLHLPSGRHLSLHRATGWLPG